MTLLRNAGKARDLPPLPETDWPIEEFALVRSTPTDGGSAYAVLARFALTPGR